MMALGRGLSELLSEVEVAYDNNSDQNSSNILQLDISLIKPNPYQPRKVFDKQKLQELSNSIKQHGLLQPITVTRDGNNFILIAGERRLKASELAGLNTINATVLDVEDNKLRELALIENIQRDDLNIIELAYSYAGLINDHGLTHDELAKMVSKSRSSITNTLRLLTLSVYTQQMLGSNKITIGHAKVLVGLDEQQQKLIVDSIIGQNLNVRETEQLVKNIKSNNTDNKTKTIIKTNTKIDLKPLKAIVHTLKEQNLDIKQGKDYLKIKFNSNEDIETILSFFKNN
jgi:ParB family chromosome partitioning protein